MIALIEIPHQRPARINWYEDRDELESAAIQYAAQSDREEPVDFDSAVHCLADDWHGHLLVQEAADIEAVRRYAGHQGHRVCALVGELEEAFPKFTSDEETTLRALVDAHGPAIVMDAIFNYWVTDRLDPDKDRDEWETFLDRTGWSDDVRPPLGRTCQI